MHPDLGLLLFALLVSISGVSRRTIIRLRVFPVGRALSILNFRSDLFPPLWSLLESTQPTEPEN